MAPKGSSKDHNSANSTGTGTGTVVVSAAGNVPSLQLIGTIETPCCLPQGVDFPDGFGLNYNEKHWANETTSKTLIDTIILPRIEKIQKDKDPPRDAKSLLIFDVFRGQKSPLFLENIVANGCVCAGKMTDVLLDASVNKRQSGITTSAAPTKGSKH